MIIIQVGEEKAMATDPEENLGKEGDQHLPLTSIC